MLRGTVPRQRAKDRRAHLGWETANQEEGAPWTACSFAEIRDTAAVQPDCNILEYVDGSGKRNACKMHAYLSSSNCTLVARSERSLQQYEILCIA
jgi:hypothetical protein